jgi:competence protein ComEC
MRGEGTAPPIDPREIASNNTLSDTFFAYQLFPMSNRSLRHRAPMLWLLLPFMFGLIASHATMREFPVPLLLIGAGAALAFAMYSKIHDVALLSLVGIALFLTGFAYHQLREARLAAWDHLPPRETQLRLRIDRLFLGHPDAKRVSGVATVQVSDAMASELLGQSIYFSLRLPPHVPKLLPSSEFTASGVLQPISRRALLTTFDGFLVNSGVNFRFDRGRIFGESKPPTTYRRFCDDMQRRFAATLTLGLERHPDLAAVIRGMILGEVVDLTADQHRLFVESGTLHLFSVSGLHIAAIAIALHLLLGLLRLPRVLHFILNATILWLYVDITGSSPSAIRAVMMVIVLQAAFVLRRPINPLATLSLAAFASLLQNPLQLFNASFQMSYGIVAALLLLGLPLSEFLVERTAPFRNLPKPAWSWRHHVFEFLIRWFFGACGIGLGTSLVSDVCGIVYFNLFTPGALLANLFLIPISSFTLWAGFLSLLSGFAHAKWLVLIFNRAAALTLLAMERGIQYLLTVPDMFFPARFATSAVGFCALGTLLLTMLYGYSTRWEWRRGGWLPPFLVMAATLVFAVHFDGARDPLGATRPAPPASAINRPAKPTS